VTATVWRITDDGNARGRVHDPAMRGIRLVIDDFRTDVTSVSSSRPVGTGDVRPIGLVLGLAAG
jgi:hypothetical protein